MLSKAGTAHGIIHRMEADPPFPLCLLAVHAHPDDEASKGAGTVAKYAAEGVRTVLVTCTGGEAGEILNPAADTGEARTDLPGVRRRELDEAVRIIGYAALHLLGYHDSGMPDTPHNARADNFANAPFDEVVGRLVAIIRAERPQVVLTYPEDQSRYPHPDHVRVHDVSVAAFDAAGDPERFPEAGPPWQPLKLYYLGAFTKARLEFLHAWFEEHGEESPFAEWLAMFPPDWTDPTTTRIDVRDHLDVRRRALLAHATQVAPDSIWFKVPEEVIRDRMPWDELVLARSLVDVEVPGGGDGQGYEGDLFAGCRPSAASLDSRAQLDPAMRGRRRAARGRRRAEGETR